MNSVQPPYLGRQMDQNHSFCLTFTLYRFLGFRVTWYILRGNNSAYFAFLLNGLSQKAKNLLHLEQILSFKSTYRSYFGRTSYPGKQTGSHKDVLFVRMAEKHGSTCIPSQRGTMVYQLENIGYSDESCEKVVRLNPGLSHLMTEKLSLSTWQ